MRAFGIGVPDPNFGKPEKAIEACLKERPELEGCRCHTHYSWEQLVWVVVFVDPTNTREFIPLQMSPTDMIPSTILGSYPQQFRPTDKVIKFAPEKFQRVQLILD